VSTPLLTDDIERLSVLTNAVFLQLRYISISILHTFRSEAKKHNISGKGKYHRDH